MTTSVTPELYRYQNQGENWNRMNANVCLTILAALLTCFGDDMRYINAIISLSNESISVSG